MQCVPSTAQRSPESSPGLTRPSISKASFRPLWFSRRCKASSGTAPFCLHRSRRPRPARPARVLCLLTKRGLGNLIRPHPGEPAKGKRLEGWAAHQDRGHALTFPRRFTPGSCIVTSLGKTEGAGNAGRTVSTHGPVYKEVHERSHHRSAATIGIPCANGFTAFFELSPGIGFLAPVIGATPKHRRQLDLGIERSGPHDFTVRSGTFVQRTASVHRIPRPTLSDDRETPLHPGAQDAGRSARDLPDVTRMRACDTLARRANQLVSRGPKR
jgi:hypothetical protein